MSYAFNVDEIFKVAEQIEKNGKEFYRKLAENISNTLVSQFFLNLADMEAEHEKVFTSMRADLTDQEQKPTVFDLEGETALYLRALADLQVFGREGKKDFILSDDLPEQDRIRRVHRAAIGLEMESIVFYLGMKELVPKRLGKDKIDKIIKEEMGHIRLLSGFQKKLLGTGIK